LSGRRWGHPGPSPFRIAASAVGRSGRRKDLIWRLGHAFGDIATAYRTTRFGRRPPTVVAAGRGFWTPARWIEGPLARTQREACGPGLMGLRCLGRGGRARDALAARNARARAPRRRPRSARTVGPLGGRRSREAPRGA